VKDKRTSVNGQGPRNGNESSQNLSEQTRVQAIDNQKRKRITYLTVRWNGRHYRALLDTGSEISVIGTRLLPRGIQLAPPGRDLFAANRTRISLLGYTVMQFCCNGVPYSVRLAVTDAMQEMILGSDFLVRNSAKWDFGTGKLQLNGRWIPLGRRRVAGRVHRICVAQEREDDASLQRQVRRKSRPSDHRSASRFFRQSRNINVRLV